jgi:WD40 repeat protein
VKLWGTADHTRLASLSAGADSRVAFSPDGRTLAAGTLYKGVLLWKAADHTRLASLSASTATGPVTVYSVAFSPDGRMLVAGTQHGAVLWDTANHVQLASLSAGTKNAVYSVAFSPDGRTLAAGTNDGTVRLFPGQLLWRSFAALRREVCGVVLGGLTPTIWRTYAPGIEYRDPCP